MVSSIICAVLCSRRTHICIKLMLQERRKQRKREKGVVAIPFAQEVEKSTTTKINWAACCMSILKQETIWLGTSDLILAKLDKGIIQP